MEKLIELLNEYERSKGYEGLWEIKNGIPYFDDELPRTKEYISVLICAKPYGFIQWLVENDKIDIDKLEKKVLKENLIRKFDEGLLMLLSISDTPTEDLLLYLK